MSHYQLLNLSPTATTEEIKAAYNRERAHLLVTEAESGNHVNEQLNRLDEAYTTLTDAERRIDYDRSLGIDTPAQAIAVTEQPTGIVTYSPPQISTGQQTCPHCGSMNLIQANTCEKCGGQIARPCPQCGQRVMLSQKICSRCNTLISEYDERRFTEAVTLEKHIQEERRIAEARVVALEASHMINRRAGIVFWLVVAGLGIGLILLAIILFSLLENTF
ncbi:MAG: DnaJ domain-containing protein [Anaerolineae bacterium]|nr:DnaJ domain-containing protein [Anaerolineae bacterium]